jgi:hypothetical protein
MAQKMQAISHTLSIFYVLCYYLRFVLWKYPLTIWALRLKPADLVKL